MRLVPGRLGSILVSGSLILLTACGGDETTPSEAGAGPHLQKRLLGPEINSSYSELRPVPSPDGNALYFTRENYPAPESLTMVEQVRDQVETVQSEFCSAIGGMAPELIAELAEEERKFLESQLDECADGEIGKEIREWGQRSAARSK